MMCIGYLPRRGICALPCPRMGRCFGGTRDDCVSLWIVSNSPLGNIRIYRILSLGVHRWSTTRKRVLQSISSVRNRELSCPSISETKKVNNGISVYDTMSGRHHGPIYSIKRSPVHSKFFLTVGDWTARLWVEDLKTPILTTKYHPAYLTSACWSPTRPGVFYVTREDGVVDIWDYFYRQNEVAYSHKVSDAPLSSIAVHSNGKLVALGDKNGTVSLIQVCDSLAVQQSNEKLAISGMLERETKREKNLEIRSKEIARKQAKAKQDLQQQRQQDSDEKQASDMSTLLQKVDEEFLNIVQNNGVAGTATESAERKES
mmetsp:Transcript_6400/g.14131  ORF Transcript_6400/g.14131 Transcript_6400/m.14131 type:complete len:316 (-) Transcript_6400:32-979(-)